MTPFKRFFDIISAIVLGTVLLPVMIWVAVLILVRDGRPVFYVAERMKTPTQSFGLIKFRTMRPAADDIGVSGGDKHGRLTRTGAMLRAKRLDELPQILNVLKGDISLVGPRPPLRLYVERFPEIYAEVLKSRPGITGLATLYFHEHEEYLLASCRDAAETDRVYSARCVPRKARIDMIYQRNRSFCYDWEITLKTVFRRLR
ncbi:sugar transferase [Pelagivirga sediminicola]|uniref:Sugar transferase n=1 Tax=Pelagivirga sediminicola TaxID=2170575 RepID=A0A2T7G653_9RHOB|nr:sugar transferase [Pelagivirga sediminicola]PVA09847.1 sugar transferase [Pelagivirga sediminicola]